MLSQTEHVTARKGCVVVYLKPSSEFYFIHITWGREWIISQEEFPTFHNSFLGKLMFKNDKKLSSDIGRTFLPFVFFFWYYFTFILALNDFYFILLFVFKHKFTSSSTHETFSMLNKTPQFSILHYIPLSISTRSSLSLSKIYRAKKKSIVEIWNLNNRTFSFMYCCFFLQSKIRYGRWRWKCFEYEFLFISILLGKLCWTCLSSIFKSQKTSTFFFFIILFFHRIIYFSIYFCIFFLYFLCVLKRFRFHRVKFFLGRWRRRSEEWKAKKKMMIIIKNCMKWSRKWWIFPSRLFRMR